MPMCGRHSDSQMRGFNHCQSCGSRSVNESPGRARRTSDEAPIFGEHFDIVVGLSSHNARERCASSSDMPEIVMLKPPDDGTRLELSSFVRPGSVPGSPAAMANELGLRNVAFEVSDLQAAVGWAATEGYGLVGGIGEYEGAWRMAYVRGPEGIIVSLAERIG
jgi:catechol 2,3-dioxygenase-like lactoylglutathione lyase family enzyme